MSAKYHPQHRLSESSKCNIINIISVINSRMNYTMISLPNPPNDNQSPTIETTAQFAQLLDIGDGMDIGQRLASVKRDNNLYLIRFRNGLSATAVGKVYENLMEQVEQILSRKLHLKPFPKTQQDNLTDIIYKDKHKNIQNLKTIANDLTPNNIKHNNNNNSNNIQLQYDYRLTEKQLDSEFDNYFNTGGFFSDARSANSSTAQSSNMNTPNTNNKQNITQIKSQHKMVINNSNHNELGPLSPTFNNKANNKANKNQLQRSKRVKPSPLQQRIKKKRISSYQSLYTNDLLSPQITQTQIINDNNLQSPMRNTNNSNTHYQMQMHSPLKNNVYYQQQEQQQQQQQQGMMSPNGMYTQNMQQQGQGQGMKSPNNYDSYDTMQNQQIYNDYYEPQSHINNNEYNDEYDRAERELTNQLNHLTHQEQQLVNSIHQRQQNQLNRAVQPRRNSYRRR